MPASLSGPFCFLAFSRIDFAASLSAEGKEADNRGFKGQLAGPRAGGSPTPTEGRGQEAQTDPHAS